MAHSIEEKPAEQLSERGEAHQPSAHASSQYEYRPGVWAGSVPDPLPRKSSAESERKPAGGGADLMCIFDHS